VVAGVVAGTAVEGTTTLRAVASVEEATVVRDAVETRGAVVACTAAGRGSVDATAEADVSPTDVLGMVAGARSRSPDLPPPTTAKATPVKTMRLTTTTTAARRGDRRAAVRRCTGTTGSGRVTRAGTGGLS
jgi:hypothetical protein